MSIQNIEPKIFRLSRAEKAELLQRLVQEVGNTWAGIEKTAGVSGGEAYADETVTANLLRQAENMAKAGTKVEAREYALS